VSKIRVGIVAGGQSSEHEISCISAAGVLAAIDREKFEPVLIGITKSGKWVLPPLDIDLSVRGGVMPEMSESFGSLTAGAAELDIEIYFPVLHGPYGEDGTIQGLFEMLGKRYVGSGVLASAAAMDKSFAKSIFAADGLAVAAGTTFVKSQWGSERSTATQKVADLGLPLFVKPARGGSSRGTTKVKSLDDLVDAIEYAFEFESKVMVETAVVGKEVECAVLHDGKSITASPVGEIRILGNHEFYDFEAKYLDDATEVIVPAEIPADIADQLRAKAIAAFTALGCEGLARVDFFYSNSGEIIINEINTMPGFTATSVFPKLMAANGISYSEIISRLLGAAASRELGVTR